MGERESLEEAVKSGDRRRSLVALRDYLAHELEANLCNTCLNSRLRTGDTAALVLRLTKVMEEIDAIPEHSGEVSDLDAIRARRNGTPASPDKPRSPQSVERRQGGRRPSGTRGA
jgi:hypothetical protein